MSLYKPFRQIFLAMLLFACLFFPAIAVAASGSGIAMIGVDEVVDKISQEGKGKVVIMTVFASWCAPCKEETPMLVETRKLVDESNLMIIGISSDENIRDLNAFVKKYQVNFPVYTGTGELFQVLGITAIPHMFIFNRKGELVESFVGLMPEPTFKLILARLLSEPGV